MSGHSHNTKRGPVRWLFENSAFLIAGAIAALVWANVDNASYDNFVHGPLWGEKAEGGHPHNTLAFIVNDILMAFFFAIAGKEVWESLLPGGSLANPKKAAVPLLATAGGMFGPIAVYMGGVFLFNGADVTNGWAIPCATDIAFSYMVARIIFGPGHPAIAFLLLLAIADDACGLIILAVFYPSAPIAPQWLLLTAAAIATGFIMRKLKIKSHWAYLLGPGAMSWCSFYFAHLHPALGLVPIIPCIPHAHTDLGMFVKKELKRDDPLNAFEHWWKNPVELFLGLFGLCNAGVAFGSFGLATYLVLAGLLIGKPVGITLCTLIAEKVFKLELPKHIGYREIVSIGFIAAIGFTVALFVSTAAFPLTGANAAPKEVLDAAKMGALLSFSAVIISIVYSKIVGIKPLKPEDDSSEDQNGHENHAEESVTA